VCSAIGFWTRWGDLQLRPGLINCGEGQAKGGARMELEGKEGMERKQTFEANKKFFKIHV